VKLDDELTIQMRLHSAQWHVLIQQDQIVAFVAITHQRHKVFMMNPCEKLNLTCWKDSSDIDIKKFENSTEYPQTSDCKTSR